MPRTSRARLWGPWLEGPCGSQSWSPEKGGLRVTRCDEEEDTKAGPGPGQAALVSLLGSWPLRQVQETDRQGKAEQARCSSQTQTPQAQHRGCGEVQWGGPRGWAGRCRVRGSQLWLLLACWPQPSAGKASPYVIPGPSP